jgi:hypothetical protein
MSSTGTASKVVQYGVAGELTAGSALTSQTVIKNDSVTINSTGASTNSSLVFFDSAKASLSRATGANGVMVLANIGSGALSITNGSGTLKLENTAGSITLDGATGKATFSQPVVAPSLSGECISDLTTITSSSVAASSTAVKAAYDLAANKLDLTTATAQSVVGPITFNSGLTIGPSRTISHPELVYVTHNGVTTAPSSIVQFGGATFFGLPGTTSVEAINEYGNADTGLNVNGVFTAPIAGRYFYSYTYSGSVSTTLTVYKNNGSSNAVKQRVGTGTQLSVTGSVSLTIAQTLWAALGVTSTLNANFNNIYIQLLL